MENRLPWQKLCPILLIACFFCFSNLINAQSFSLSYTGPDTLYAGNDCKVALNWGQPNSISFTATNGFNIDTFYVDTISGGWKVGDTILAPNTIYISYFVQDTTGTNEVLDSVLKIVIAEKEAPVISVAAKDTTVYCNMQNLSFANWLSNHGMATAVDNCTTIDNSDSSNHWTLIDIDTLATSCKDTVQYTAIFEVKDLSGNADSTTATFIQIDTMGPNIEGLIKDTAQVCGGNDLNLKLEQWFIRKSKTDFFDDCNGEKLDFVRINYRDKDGNTGNWTGVGVPLASFVPKFDCTWYLDAEIIFADDCGRRASDSARFSLIDTIAPVLADFPMDSVIYCNQTFPATANVSVSDNCDTALVLTFADQLDTMPTFIQLSRSWTAMDDCGNSVSKTQVIRLIDTIAPVLANIPKDTMIACGEMLPTPPTITATDDCTLPIDIRFQFNETTNQLSHPDSCRTYSYTITRTWIAIDAFNNADSMSQNIQVIDTIAPTFMAPAEIRVSCELRDSLTITGQPSNISDNCDTIPRFSYTDLVIGGDCIGTGVLDTVIRTWTVMDACGNSNTGTQRILLIDTTPPIITNLAMDTMVLCLNRSGIFPITGTGISVMDNCTQNPIIQFIGETNTKGNQPDSCNFYNYSLTRTWRTTDACANSSDFSQNITIIDTLAPTIICPDELIVENTTGKCDGIVSVPMPHYFDNCTGTAGKDSLSLTQNFTHAQGGDVNTTPVDTLVFNFNIGNTSFNKPISSSLTLTIHLNNVDGEGTNETFRITGEDGQVFANTNTSSAQCGNSTTVLTIDANTANEYAKDSIISFTLGANGSGMEAINNVCTNGNANVIIEYEYEIPAASIKLSYAINGGTIDTLSSSIDTMLALGMHTISYYAEDCSGNRDSCQLKVSVIDKEAPSFDCPGNFVSYTAAGDCIAMLNMPMPSNLKDNCDTFTTSIITYTIADSNDVVMKSGQLDSLTAMVNESFNIGVNRVTYTLRDTSGNSASCLFLVEVRDTIPPNIVCKPTFTVKTNPAGLPTDLNLIGDSILSSLSDNCNIASVTISPAQVACTDTNSIMATVTVTDSSGNMATCQTNLQIITESLDPTYSIGACNNDTLYLYADTTFETPIPANTSLTYNWTGPNGFSSNDANPIIPNVGPDNSGTYSLTMTGSSACTSSGTVFININTADVPSINAASTTVCSSDGITLTTSSVNCNQLEYQWYEVIERADPLADTTVFAGSSTVPSFFIDTPAVGRHSYYLIVKCDDCSSLGSEIVTITVLDVPPAATNEAIINICEGENIVLGSPLTDQSLTYKWVGPGFVSDLPTPAPIMNATTANEGIYTLTVSKNGCMSKEAFTVVNLTSKPAKPGIAVESGTQVCEGSPLVLKTNVTNATVYNWNNTSTFASYTTTTPELRIDTAALQDGGNWTVSIEIASCASEASDPLMVSIENKPIGTPFFEGAACEGKNISLNVNPALTNAGYEWKNATGTSYFGVNPEVPVADEYSLVITSQNGCVNQVTLPIKIEKTPVITSIFDSGDANPCITPDATNLEIIADVFPANDGNYTYTWTSPNGTTMAPSSDSVLTIPNASSSTVNGTYTLVVTNGVGCASNPASNLVDVSDIPVPNPSITANSTNLCEGETLTLTATEYPSFSASYRWQITSLLDTVTQSPILVLESITTAFNGMVSLQVSNGDCVSAGTANLNINVSTPLPKPAIQTSSAPCSGEILSLMTTEVEGATYFWEGPSFTATSSTPSIIISGNASLENSGGYTVQVLLNGCTSPKSDPLTLTIGEIPAPPVISNSGNVCLDNPKDIILFIGQDNLLEGALFNWYDANSGDIVMGSGASKSLMIKTDTLQAGTYRFYATQSLNGCESAQSNITEVTLANIPSELAQVCENTKVICDPDNAVICALAPSEGIGTWTTASSNVTFENPNAPMTTVKGLQPGGKYTLFWTLSNNVCGDYSATKLELEVGVTKAVAKVCNPLMEVCEGSTLNLCANAVPTGFSGKWTQPSNQTALGITINNPTSPNATIANVEAGTPFNSYKFYWTIVDTQGLCEATDSMQINLYKTPSEKAVIADASLISCDQNIQLNANAFANGLTGNWSSVDTSIRITSPNTASTTINNLRPGMNRLTWSLSSGACVNYSSDEITVYYETAPIANKDTFSISFNGSAILNVKRNDQVFSPEFDIEVLSAPKNGTATMNSDGNISYTAKQNFVGTDVFTYELCSPTCANECAVGTVELKIGDDAECMVPTIMTPNGDGINDAFSIPCMETGKYPNNEVIIFNQWGDEIYRAAPYKNDWQGTYDGADIPVGTYYYVISFGESIKPKAGFLIIER